MMCALHLYKLHTNIYMVYIRVTHMMSTSDIKHIPSTQSTHVHVHSLSMDTPTLTFKVSIKPSPSLSLFLPSSLSATVPSLPVPICYVANSPAEERPGLRFLKLQCAPGVAGYSLFFVPLLFPSFAFRATGTK